MRILLRIVPLTLWVAAGATGVHAQPAGGSRLPREKNACAACHGEAGLWDADQARLLISEESLAEDVHFLKGVNCHDCHGGDPSLFGPEGLHAEEDGFRASLGEVKKACGKCHEAQQSGVIGGVHARAGEPDAQGRKTPLDCGACHGQKTHGMLAVRDPRAAVFLNHQVQLCGRCHQEDLAEYLESVHGYGLQQSGLLVTAVCADCHGAHGIYPPENQRSTLWAGKVAATCGECHRFIEQRLEKSAHGYGGGAGAEKKQAAANEKAQRKPSCTDCHPGHDLPRPESKRFRMGVPDRCGDCHPRFSQGYAISMHGELTELGYESAAKCSDCHGTHDVLPISDPASRMSAANRSATCKKCHPQATRNFLDYDPHADHRDPRRDAVLHGVYVALMTLLISTFGFFGLHSLLWFVRSLIDVLKHGRPKGLVPGTTAYVRFGPFHRVAHNVMVLSFLGLAATGLPLKYSHQPWAQTLATALGGFESTGAAHRIFGLLNIGCLVVYAARMLARFVKGPESGGSRWGVIFGPDSPLPTPRDVKDFFKMLRWFFGLGRKPTFERWTYWEKFDFWGACADIVIIGATGLVLWFPDLFCAYLPGKVLNIAKVIHSTQALLATGFVFAVHFFGTHLRPEKFPMDMAVLTGLVSEEHMEEERPDYLERMRGAGKLDQLRTTVPEREVLGLSVLGGSVALAAGLLLLAGILAAVLGS